MDVYGLEPTSKAGAYFRRSIWGWHPLAELVCTLAPRITMGCRHWHSNDADGLDCDASRKLARVLRRTITSGRAAKLIAKRNAAVAALPDERCSLCKGTGVRDDDLGRAQGQPQKVIGTETEAEPDHPRRGEIGWCNGCDGRGANPASATHYTCGLDDLTQFADFLESCGGFEIC
jgi:hypothetical protein